MITIDKLVEQSFSDGIERLAVSGIIFNQDKCLLLQRFDDDFLGGFYETPGGGVEDKESIIHAINREVKEETNLTVTEIKEYAGFFDYSSGNGNKTRNLSFIIGVDLSENIQLTEHKSFVWASKMDIGDLKISPEMRKSIEVAWNIHNSQ